MSAKSSTSKKSQRALLNVAQTAVALNCSPTTVMRRASTEKTFPQPIYIMGNRRAWYEDEVAAYVNSRPRVFA